MQVSPLSNFMKDCVIHIGMHKTGTSSIQMSLRHGLDDPGFLYVDFDEPNGSQAMTILFRDVSESISIYGEIGWSARHIARYKTKVLHRLERSLTHAPRNVCPIISAEACWWMNRTEFERIRAFMADRGYRVRIIVYLRPWKQWAESMFQESVKHSQNTPRELRIPTLLYDYPERIQMLEAVFGPEQVQVFKYDPRTFPEGCVVRHFCEQLGIHFDARRIRRANESLKLPAVQLLYAHWKLGPQREKSELESLASMLVTRQLQKLDGPSFCIHSSLFEPYVPDMARQRFWLEQRLGVSFEEDIYAHDDRSSIREEADLLNFSPDTVSWLAAATRSAAVAPVDGAVCDQMHRLYQSAVRKARFLRVWYGVRHRLFWTKKYIRRFYPAFDA
jgi:hypothetical protein